MSRSMREIYVGKAFTIAKTIVVKHDETAIAINDYLTSVKGYVIDPNNRWTWPYYLNMAGIYHQADMDELAQINGNGVGYMTVKVAGPDGPVDTYFTKELLYGPDADVSLLNEFTYDSRAYKDLLERYPAFESLILGILNPVDLTTAIFAPNHSVLYCGDYFAEPYNDAYDQLIYRIPDDRLLTDNPLIEPQEITLIPKIQAYIKNAIFRWNTPEYQNIDNLYWSTLLINVYAYLPTTILNIRLSECLTEKANTYHIREYLDSNGLLGRHVQNIPLEQSLYLYRNVKYHNANFGKQDTFNELVKKMLTPTRVPIAGYNAVHTTSVLPDEIYPVAEMAREAINFASVGGNRDVRSIDYILEREIDLARLNNRYLPEVSEETNTVVKRSGFSELSTKVLESTMIDYTNTERYTLPDTLFYMWIWATCNNRYRGTVYITHPYTSERIQLSPLNALILFFYVVTKGLYGTAPINIPVLKSRWIPRTPTMTPPSSLHDGYPDMARLRFITSKPYTTDLKLQQLFPVTSVPTLNYTSSKAFYLEVESIWVELMRKQTLLYKEEDLHARGDLERCIREFYWHDVTCDPNKRNETYEAWIIRQGLDFDGLDSEDFLKMGLDIVTRATGANYASKKSIADLQQSMLDIMKHFSSYTVQYLKGITFGSPVNTDGKLIRLSDTAYNRGLSGKLGGVLPLYSYAGRMTIDPLIGEFIPLRYDGAGYEPALEDSGFHTTISGESVREGFDVSVGKWTYKHEVSLQAITGSFSLTANPIED